MVNEAQEVLACGVDEHSVLLPFLLSFPGRVQVELWSRHVRSLAFFFVSNFIVQTHLDHSLTINCYF